MGDTFSLGGMLLGASSAATQVEGGDRNNNWYDWYRRGNIKDGSDPSVATMHWEHWQEDAELMAAMGLQCARLGLEWSRIEPERGVFDESAVQHFPTYKVPNGENLPVGEYIGWTSPRNIEPIPAKVVSVENQVATIDFNHPLAGKDIVYWVKLLDVSD